MMECQDYSSTRFPKNFENEGEEKFVACDYNYFCHKNGNCLIFHRRNILDITDLDYVYGHNYESENNNLIILSCDESSLKNKSCNTEKCVGPNNCFSNNCVDGICITNKEDPIYNCGTVKENSEFKVKCKLNYEEKCKDDTDCTIDAKCNKDHICQVKSRGYKNTINYFIVSIFAISTVILII
ncbi:hypothetical protein PIROE2DRAFT_7955 [Piromyces sp. E2]|nr:hypothetical protein PIROE2DRAFT_7955 [Piromyces sp. E2]|eukprot:OUM65067.1 hypothetical protein PIROE2DRAFT_7955 [Piromyces sp. E2]